MFPFQLLPAALMALMSASPALTALAATSKNDPFRAIALQIPPKPDLPVCCLRPLLPLEPVEDDVLLSFEEWKVKQSAEHDQAKTKNRSETFNRSAQAAPSEVTGNGGNGSEVATDVVSEIAAPGSPLDVVDTITLPSVALSPHFMVPLTDRFNYANLDCSARVHLSHRSAKSSSSILSSKRDRYMLSPCNPPNKEQQFVVVELCEDIRIDTVQLANFEFFSGVFKDFRVSVAKTYTTDGEGWTTAGTYRAKNIRGVQVCVINSFHGPPEVDSCVNSHFIHLRHFGTFTVISASTFYLITEMNFTVLFLFSGFTASHILKNGNGKHGRLKARLSLTVQPRRMLRVLRALLPTRLPNIHLYRRHLLKGMASLPHLRTRPQ
jgi:Sad1 / UNC-like C-terminal